MKLNLFFFLIISQIILAQQNEKKTFNMAIVKPNNAKIDNSLQIYTDTIRLSYINQYYSYKSELKEMLSFDFENNEKDGNDDFEINKNELKNELSKLDSLENEVLNFKYYDLLSYSSTIVLNMIFNEDEPYSTIIEIPYWKIENVELSKFANENSLDYILLFNNINTFLEDDMYKIKTTIRLYSSKETKIILEKDIIGNTNSYGDLWTCSNDLACLLLTTSKNSIDEILPVIYRDLK